MEQDEVIRVLRAFEAIGLEYVLIGAAAMGAHGLVRATAGLDVFIRAKTENVERLRASLRQAYDADPHIDEISSADLLGDYPVVRYVPPTSDLYFDVITLLGKSVSFEDIQAETMEVQDTKVKVATLLALYRLKKGTVRGQDHLDAALIGERFNSKGLRTNMPVQKFRSIEEMNEARAPESQTPTFERFLRHCARYGMIARKHYSRGVSQFRSIEEAQEARKNFRKMDTTHQ